MRKDDYLDRPLRMIILMLLALLVTVVTSAVYARYQMGHENKAILDQGAK